MGEDFSEPILKQSHHDIVENKRAVIAAITRYKIVYKGGEIAIEETALFVSNGWLQQPLILVPITTVLDGDVCDLDYVIRRDAVAHSDVVKRVKIKDNRIVPRLHLRARGITTSRSRRDRMYPPSPVESSARRIFT